MNNSNNKLTSKRRNSKTKSKSKSSSPQRRHSRSRSRSRSRSGSSEGPPVLKRQHKEIYNLSQKQIGQIISNRVKKAQIHPPKNWNKWNENNVELSKTKSVPYPEYNEVFDI